MIRARREARRERLRRAESLFAQYLVQAEGPDAMSLEQFLARHANEARDLRRLQTGLTRVELAVSPRRRREVGYELLSELGRGGHGVVHRARDKALDRVVAIKTLDQDVETAASRRRFLDEARVMAKVRHENVVQIRAVDEFAGAIRIVMEYIDGRSFERVVEEDGPLCPRSAARVGVDLCRALGALHDAGVVHMDVKPGNLMRERGGRTVLLDFSLARTPSLEDEPVGGTPPFMAPEHFGHGAPGPRTDIYGVGVTLYWLVTGRYPLAERSLVELREAILGGRARPLAEVAPEVPRAFARIVGKAMSARSEERHDSAACVERALREFLGEAPGTRVTETPGARISQQARRTRRLGPGSGASRWLAALARKLFRGFAGHRVTPGAPRGEPRKAANFASSVATPTRAIVAIGGRCPRGRVSRSPASAGTGPGGRRNPESQKET